MSSLRIGERARLECMGPCEIHVRGRLEAASFSYLGPATSETSTAYVVFLVDGTNGASGHLDAEPKAVRLGTKSTVAARVFAPSGTLWVESGATVHGKLVGRDVLVGTKARVVGDGT
jgi:hypothetical protein